MMEILKKYGAPTGVATLVVLAITFVPIYYQWQTAKAQNAKIEQLEKRVQNLEARGA